MAVRSPAAEAAVWESARFVFLMRAMVVFEKLSGETKELLSLRIVKGEKLKKMIFLVVLKFWDSDISTSLCYGGPSRHRVGPPSTWVKKC
jgi:hypothetical protein